MISKKKCLVIIAITLILALVVPSKGVFAANKKVKTVDIVQSNGTMTVSGEVEEGMLAVAVQVLDSSNKLVTLETGAVDSSNKYKVEISVEEDNYVVKVADYDGGIAKTYGKEDDETDVYEPTASTDEETTSNETKTETDVDAANPKTGDSILRVCTVLGIAILGVFITTKFKRKRRTTRKH